MKRRSFGAYDGCRRVDIRPATKTLSHGQRRAANTTFERKHDAETWLSRAETEISEEAGSTPTPASFRWPSSALAG